MELGMLFSSKARVLFLLTVSLGIGSSTPTHAIKITLSDVGEFARPVTHNVWLKLLTAGYVAFIQYDLKPRCEFALAEAKKFPVLARAIYGSKNFGHPRVREKLAEADAISAERIARNEAFLRRFKWITIIGEIYAGTIVFDAGAWVMKKRKAAAEKAAAEEKERFAVLLREFTQNQRQL